MTFEDVAVNVDEVRRSTLTPKYRDRLFAKYIVDPMATRLSGSVYPVSPKPEKQA